MGFLTSLLWYSVLFIVLIAVAVAGVLIGKKLRDRKDKQLAAIATEDKKDN